MKFHLSRPDPAGYSFSQVTMPRFPRLSTVRLTAAAIRENRLDVGVGRRPGITTTTLFNYIRDHEPGIRLFRPGNREISLYIPVGLRVFESAGTTYGTILTTIARPHPSTVSRTRDLLVLPPLVGSSSDRRLSQVGSSGGTEDREKPPTAGESGGSGSVVRVPAPTHGRPMRQEVPPPSDRPVVVHSRGSAAPTHLSRRIIYRRPSTDPPTARRIIYRRPSADPPTSVSAQPVPAQSVPVRPIPVRPIPVRPIPVRPVTGPIPGRPVTAPAPDELGFRQRRPAGATDLVLRARDGPTVADPSVWETQTDAFGIVHISQVGKPRVRSDGARERVRG